MGKKIKKEDILKGILNKINACLEYQKVDPDKTAEKRIEMLENDPCGDLTYYVNITLKRCMPEDSVNLSDRIKHIENKRYLPLLKEFNSAYEDGCIITVNVIKNEDKTYGYSISASSYGSFDSIFTTLMSKYFDDSCLFSLLKPKKPLIGDNYIEDDFNTAIESGKTSIVYGMARFNKKTIEEILKKQFDTDRYDLYSYDVTYFYDVAYPDMTRRTSFEQNVNQFLGGGAVNSVTMFGAKSKLPDYNIKSAHGVYDMVRYVTETLDEIKNCDDAQSRKKYNKYSEGVFKDYSEAKYDTYLSNGGSGDWATIADAQGQFLTFKAVSSYDTDFKEEALSNGTYSANLKAYEVTADLFSNAPMETITTSWKKETDIFKKKTVSGISITNDPTSAASSSAQSLVMATMVDPPTVIVKPYAGSKIEFNKTITYEFNVCVPHTDEVLENDEAHGYVVTKSYERGTMVSDPTNAYERVKGYFSSSNTISIKRDTIKLDSSEYSYTNVKIVYDKENEKPFTNETTQETNIYEIPPESYYNRAMHKFFKASDLDNPRVIQSTIIYYIIPKKVTIPVKFIQHSRWENREAADEHEKEVREEYKDNFIRICVDSIPYDPWDRLIEKLEKLYGKWNSLQPDCDGNFELPPINEVDENELDSLTCKNCGNTMRNCTCNRQRLCSKCFPLDLTGITESLNLDFSLFKAVTYIFNFDGTPATYVQIAKEIYNAIYSTDKHFAYESEFETITWKSLSILSINYDRLILTPSFKVRGSVVNQIERSNFVRFKKEYLNLLLTSYDSITKKFAKTLPIGLMDGIMYMPTGYDITFEFDVNTYQVTLDGVPQSMMQSISTLMSDQTADYDTVISKVKSLFSGSQIPENVLKYMIFPYNPNIMNMISSTNLNQSEYLASFKEEYVYKVNVSDLSNVKSSLTGSSSKVPVRFSIYLKRPVHCSYPRCEDPIYENDANNGICELDQYFRTPTIVGLIPFSFEKEYKKRKARLLVQQMRKDTKNLIENVMNVKKTACNEDKNLEIIDNVKLKALNELFEFGNNYRSLLTMVPEDPIASSKASIVCAASNRTKLKSIMEDYNEVFNHLISTILVLKEDHFNVNEQKFASIISDLSVCSDIVSKYYEEVSLKSQNYNMCSTKFADYIDKDQQFKKLEDGMMEKEMAAIEKAVENVTSERIEHNAIHENVLSLNLNADDTVKLSQMIANGNVPGVKAFVEDNQELIKKKSNNSATKSILNVQNSVESILDFSKADSFDKSLLKTVSNVAKKELNAKSIEQVSLKSMTDPSEMLSFGQKTLSNLKK